MLRIISKSRCNFCEKYQTTSRLYTTARYYSLKENELCPPPQPSRFYRTVRYYSKKENDLCPPGEPVKSKGGGKGLLYAIGALTLVGGGIAYAKYDPDFRQWLATNVPYSDDALKFLLQEEKTYWERIASALEELKFSILGLFQDTSDMRKTGIEQIEEVPKDYKPPPAVLPALEKENKENDDKYTEIRMETKEAGKKDAVVEIGGDVKPKESDLRDTSLKNLADIEKKIGESASIAVQAYNSALYALRNYNLDVERIIEDSVTVLDPQIWDSLKTKREVKDKTLKDAETSAAEAVQYINKLKILLNKKDFEGSNTAKEQVRHNIQQVQDDIAKAKKELEQELKLSNITEKYWARVQEARKYFAQELETLFPTINLDEKKLHVDESDFDLFVLHAFTNVLFYQKELAKLDTISDARLQQAVDTARRGNAEVLTRAQIQQELNKEKRRIEECYEMRCLALRCEAEKELRRQMKVQSEAFSDHLDDAIRTTAMEVEREYARKLDEQLEAERCKFKMQLAAIMGRLRGLEQAYKARAEADQAARQAQVLWSACQALFRSVKSGCPGIPWQNQLRPLTAEIKAIKKASAEGDELVKAVLNGIPKEAKDRGVFPEDALKERFLKVERLASSLALVPEGGGSLVVHFLSYIQSLLLVKAASPIPQSELNDEAVDFSKLSTNDILQRARYWLDRGNFAQTLRYMNLLKGAPRCVAREWMTEARVLLETQQAADTLMAHAAASGLRYL